jgi:hypothetical protein
MDYGPSDSSGEWGCSAPFRRARVSNSRVLACLLELLARGRGLPGEGLSVRATKSRVFFGCFGRFSGAISRRELGFGIAWWQARISAIVGFHGEILELSAGLRVLWRFLAQAVGIWW